MLYDDYGQPDYEGMILEKQEILFDCSGDCEFCPLDKECPYIEED